MKLGSCNVHQHRWLATDEGFLGPPTQERPRKLRSPEMKRRRLSSADIQWTDCHRQLFDLVWCIEAFRRGMTPLLVECPSLGQCIDVEGVWDTIQRGS